VVLVPGGGEGEGGPRREEVLDGIESGQQRAQGRRSESESKVISGPLVMVIDLVASLCERETEGKGAFFEGRDEGGGTHG